MTLSYTVDVLVEPEADTNADVYTLPEVLPAAWWKDRAMCAGADPELFFPSPTEFVLRVRQAKLICSSCPVTGECRADVDLHEEGLGRSRLFGVFAGETPAERWRRRRKVVELA